LSCSCDPSYPSSSSTQRTILFHFRSSMRPTSGSCGFWTCRKYSIA
jgi:hypothetical protein